MAHHPLKLFSGTSHPELAEEIAKKLQTKLRRMHISRFASGEIYAKPLETVRGSDVFLVQTITHNVNDDFMELFVMLDAFKRSFAEKVHLVMPYFGYARQDRVATPREPISAKLMADLISTAGADHVITMALHSDQEQGFFDFPVDNLYSRKFFADYFKKKKLKNMVVVSPDAGGAKDAKKFADILGAELAIIHKTRPKKNVSEVMELVGNVKGKNCIIFDDMIDTGGSVVNAAKALRDHKSNKDIYLAATHPVFSKDAHKKLAKAGFKEVVVSNSIPVPEEKQFKGLKVLSIAPLLAKIIKNVYTAKSVSKVFTP
jgi:ribose-phosphate pyrophosphokinase